MKIRILKYRRLLLVSLMVAMGFFSCDKDDDDEPQIVPCYGVMECTFNGAE